MATDKSDITIRIDEPVFWRFHALLDELPYEQPVSLNMASEVLYLVLLFADCVRTSLNALDLPNDNAEFVDIKDLIHDTFMRCFEDVNALQTHGFSQSSGRGEKPETLTKGKKYKTSLSVSPAVKTHLEAFCAKRKLSISQVTERLYSLATEYSAKITTLIHDLAAHVAQQDSLSKRERYERVRNIWLDFSEDFSRLVVKLTELVDPDFDPSEHDTRFVKMMRDAIREALPFEDDPELAEAMPDIRAAAVLFGVRTDIDNQDNNQQND
jgi:hypothetical protein